MIVFFTFDLIVFGGFTRLTDSGLGCPDWPGCYGEAESLPGACTHRRRRGPDADRPGDENQSLDRNDPPLPGDGHRLPDHRADGGVWLEWRRSKGRARLALAAALLFLWVCVQGAFGAWTVTLKLQPVIVTLHLLFGMTLLALAAWLGGREDHLRKHPARHAGRARRARNCAACARWPGSRAPSCWSSWRWAGG